MAIKNGDEEERVFMSRKFLEALSKCPEPLAERHVKLSGNLHELLRGGFRGR
jgi:hypothetical protein